jgi:hypothetical protein
MQRTNNAVTEGVSQKERVWNDGTERRTSRAAAITAVAEIIQN